MLEIASTDNRTTDGHWANKYVDKIKRQVREAKQNFRQTCFCTDLKVTDFVGDEKANKCVLNITVPVRQCS